MEKPVDITEKVLHITKMRRAVNSRLPRRVIPMCKPRVDDCFSFVVAGSCRYRLEDGREYITQPGDVLYLAKGWDYSMEILTEDYQYMICNFDFATAQLNDCKLLRTNNPYAFETLFRKLVKTYAVSAAQREASAMSLLYSIYALIIQSARQEYMPGSSKAMIQQARAYIQANITQPELTVEELARRANMSQVYFRKLFAQMYDISPSKYILQQRVKHACKLMALVELRLEDVAMGAGFSSLPHMSKVFKSVMGMTPAAYRKKLHGGNG